MKNQNSQYGTVAALFMALAITCLSSSTVKANEDRDDDDDGGAIVGLWQNHFTSDFGAQFDTYSQWHRDGLEIESPSFSPGQCQGAFKNIGDRTFKLFHVGWTVGGIPGHPEVVRFELRELNVVSRDRRSFDGHYDQKFFDANGTLVAEDTGKIHAKRLTVALY